MIQVKATREGLVGHQTAVGWLIDTVFPFVALPSIKALNTWVKLVNPRNHKMCCAQVLDVGPWNEHDDGYVFQPLTTSRDAKPTHNMIIRPLAEAGISKSGKGTNGAGIDLGEAIWSHLGMTDNDIVEWEFV